MEKNHFDVVIIGGSYAGLSAAMALGRSLRNVLVIDSGKPCNIQTPHSHNFLTQDGQTPSEIARIALEQVKRYETVTFVQDTAIQASKMENGFEVKTVNKAVFTAKKIIFASGLKEIFPDIAGYAACWGISVLHCPYCHGFEVKGQNTGLIGNGETGYELVKLISNWSDKLTLFTNGKSTLTAQQREKIESKSVKIIETEISEFKHTKGKIEDLILKDDTQISVDVLYARPKTVQHSDIPSELGCSLNEMGNIIVDSFQKTNVPGVFACGDNSIFGRSVAMAVASGSMTGAFLNRELIEETF